MHMSALLVSSRALPDTESIETHLKDGKLQSYLDHHRKLKLEKVSENRLGIVVCHSRQRGPVGVVEVPKKPPLAAEAERRA